MSQTTSLAADLATDLATQFKAAFRYHPAGVALITAATPEGPVGLTASSVASVAVDPAALVFSVTRTTGSAGLILAADTFLVHLLDADHAGVAQEFAVSGGERFTPEQGWGALPTGEPHLRSARSALRARTLQQIPVGDSMLVVAEVLEIHTGSADPAASAPMVYRDRAFTRLGERL
ncbi:flavin reductase family protein [Leucobacter albus]|uniref:Flavin reductase family protein n=1 Tax=Leucobacter albus TaxID=272210 RepID=A0ABW3TRQ0_9MICO